MKPSVVQIMGTQLLSTGVTVGLLEQQQRNKSPGPKKEEPHSVSSRPSQYPSSSASPRSSVVRDSETRAQENTRRSPASTILEESG